MEDEDDDDGREKDIPRPADPSWLLDEQPDLIVQNLSEKLNACLLGDLPRLAP